MGECRGWWMGHDESTLPGGSLKGETGGGCAGCSRSCLSETGERARRCWMRSWAASFLSPLARRCWRKSNKVKQEGRTGSNRLWLCLCDAANKPVILAWLLSRSRANDRIANPQLAIERPTAMADHSCTGPAPSSAPAATDPPLVSSALSAECLVYSEAAPASKVDQGSQRSRPQCWKCRGKGVIQQKLLGTKRSKTPRPPDSAVAAGEPVQRIGTTQLPSQAASAPTSAPTSASESSTIEAVCRVCSGKGIVDAAPPNQTDSKSAQVRPFKRSWPESVRPGPPASRSLMDPEAAPQEGEMLCSFAGHWGIYQITNGHRYTTDDLATAAVAMMHMNSLSKKHPFALTHHIDLGCGLGSVLMWIAWKFHDTLVQSLGIEAQSIHVRLASRSLWLNGVEHRVSVRHGDLGDIALAPRSGPIALVPEGPVFQLVTGTPPYFPASNGALPSNQGRGMCAFELRGGIETYAQAAVRVLAPGRLSRFVVCQTALETERTIKALQAAGLVVLERWDFYGRIGKMAPLFCVFCTRWRMEADAEPMPDEGIVEAIIVRDEQGKHTAAYAEMMRLVGKPPMEGNEEGA
ncbi:uncharacterized protein BJ171DRAFT_310897 [Polychytrium aggregatum]|uniref:uncharacterized protein n=1 Tax=Polychytrium aggregatum TaxID=110093 RepID=UPI0022FEF888|nr:uncharacterized protein BJ171DRAFT_310897 [Polychytrium aggregatum]KAI9207053.1 hypothetical protein BJ171DRAFT_310897 [Polychytrium aggregatum]